MDKQHIIRQIEKKLEGNMEELGRALNTHEDASNLDEGDTRDLEDFSQQTEQKEMQLRMRIQVEQAQDQLLRLRELAGKVHTSAEAGALVETDKNWIYLGISFSPMPAGGKELIGISPGSPAFTSFMGKKKGDQVMLGKEEYKILSIQ